MTTYELRVKLAESIGLTNVRECSRYGETLPELDSLVHQAEQGLSEEQRDNYPEELYEALGLNVAYFHPNTCEISPEDLFVLITASPEDRAKALLEVMT